MDEWMSRGDSRNVKVSTVLKVFKYGQVNVEFFYELVLWCS